MNTTKRSVGIGLLGIGVIGTGTAKVLLHKETTLARRAGIPLILHKIAEKDVNKHGTLSIDKGLFTVNFEEMLTDPDIDIIIELIGGEHPAFEFVSQALNSGKHVVTANKELLAKHGYALLKLAHEHNVSLRYEASVGGGIPLISPFQQDLIANDITTIYGILNGTTNYIITRMAQENIDFSAALKQAQELGYAEANPSNDIEGLDAAYKLAIISTIAFGTEVKMRDVYYEGISRLQARDFRYAQELNYSIKLLAIAKQVDDFIEVRVHPAFISEGSLLAKVNGVYNAINVEGDLVGSLIFYGQGAGPQATSSAVISDVIKIAQNIANGIVTNTQIIPSEHNYTIKPMSEIETKYYMRMNVEDRSGVLAQISKILGDHSISISSVIQKESDPETKTAEIVIMTHPAKEQAVQDALQKTEHLDIVKEISNFVRVEA
jgi:homoserine dehydrogenase